MVSSRVWDAWTAVQIRAFPVSEFTSERKAGFELVSGVSIANVSVNESEPR